MAGGGRHLAGARGAGLICILQLAFHVRSNQSGSHRIPAAMPRGGSFA